MKLWIKNKNQTRNKINWKKLRKIKSKINKWTLLE